jgi:glycosyltransferase involved in cell wall biosynthesis
MNTVQNNKTWCVIIPTYNNAKTLKRVIDGVLNYTNHIFIVNDGSNDETADILENYKQLHILYVPQNKGKGNALQMGFKKALSLNYDYALTIDSDGQHYPSDIPVFLEELNATTEPILLIGSRNMAHESVPKKSSFGNRFSNFWFNFETGIKLSDTQSGYRLYPSLKLKLSCVQHGKTYS